MFCSRSSGGRGRGVVIPVSINASFVHCVGGSGVGALCVVVVVAFVGSVVDLRDSG
jgi:hypothetical protein